MMLDFDVAILGGGFAGVYAAKSIAKWVRRHPELRVCLISQENYMVFQPMLPEVAAASLSPRHIVNPIRQLCRGIQIFKGEVRSIDPVDKRVHVDAGDFTPNVEIGFRHLLLGLGAVIDLSRVPGMPEHSLLMQNVGDAMRLRSTIIARFEEANLVTDPEVRRQMLTFVVVGGGYSGVETAGEIHDLMQDIHRFYLNIQREDIRVILVHSDKHLLPTLKSDLGDYAQRKLEERGLQIILQRRVKAVTARTAVLDDGTIIETNTVVSTVGNGPHPVVVKLAQQLNLPTERGRIRTDRQLRVPGTDWLWAAGDCAVVPQADGKPSPATAQFALQQGKVVGYNLAAAVQGRPLRDFRYNSLGELAAIGHRTAVADVRGLRFSGFLAWWMWRTVYVGKLPGLQRKLRVIIDWTFDLFFARDINLLNPRYSRLLKSSYLEPGEVLFRAGEPAFSLYFVKEGAIDLLDSAHRVVMTVRAGDYFGERALLEDRKWMYTARAAEATHLVALGASEFDAIVQGSSALRRLFQRSAQAYLAPEEVQNLRAQLPASVLERSAGDLMNRAIDALSCDMTIRQALDIIRQRRHGSYPVVGADGKLLGVLKRDDLFDSLKRGLLSGIHHVRELPLHQLPTVSPEVPGSAIADLFIRQSRNKVLVVDREGQLLGLITLLDLLEDAALAAMER